MCKAQGTTRCRDEPYTLKLLEKRTHGEPKGEVTVGVVTLDMRKQVEFTHEPKWHRSPVIANRNVL